MSPISAINSIAAPLPIGMVGRAASGQGTAFKDFLLGSLQEVNTSQQQAGALVEQLYTGGNVNPAEAMVSMQKADMAFRLLLQVRNKLIQAFEEVKNIRV
jgi:flagellar hook-basal body complex protein FliE